MKRFILALAMILSVQAEAKLTATITENPVSTVGRDLTDGKHSILVLTRDFHGKPDAETCAIQLVISPNMYGQVLVGFDSSSLGPKHIYGIQVTGDILSVARDLSAAFEEKPYETDENGWGLLLFPDPDNTLIHLSASDLKSAPGFKGVPASHPLVKGLKASTVEGLNDVKDLFAQACSQKRTSGRQ